jgi:Bacterial regulatory proteins, luxR family
LRLVAAGLSNRKIAEFLHVSSHTVDRHVSAMLRRSGARNRASLVDVAYASKILVGGVSPPRTSGRRCIRLRQPDVTLTTTSAS